MNTTIDFKTAKTIENMSRKIDGMERAVSGFFNKMSDIAERKYGDPQVYLAAVGATKNSSEIELSPIDFSSMGWMAVPTAADVQVAMLLMAAVTPK